MSYWPDEDKEDRRQENRRTGPDDYTKFVRFSSFLSWMLLVLSALMYDAASPSEFNIYVLDQKWGKTSTVLFRENYIYASFVCTLITLILILTALAIDARRQKRKNDHFSFSLLFALIIDVLGLIGFAVYFLS